MKKHFLLIIMAFIAHYGFCQYVGFNSGSVSITSGSSIVFTDISDLENNSELQCDDSSNVYFESASGETSLYGFNNVQFGNLNVNTILNLNTNIEVLGDVYIERGQIDINDNIINLKGDLLNEGDINKVVSTGNGRILKQMNLYAGQSTNPGNLGLTIVPARDYMDITLERGHSSYDNNGNLGVKRYYQFSGENPELSSVCFSYSDNEIEGLEEASIELWGKQNSDWEILNPVLKDFDHNNFCYNGSAQYTIFTLFESLREFDIVVPEGFSPNGDGVNDYFTIEGLSYYPDNSIVIFNRWGHKVFESAPYQSNWDGISQFGLIVGGDELPTGTYYYVLKLDKEGNNVKTGNVFLNR